jgi:3-oxoacyl-[acyl-carrier-protein] synthase-1
MAAPAVIVGVGMMTAVGLTAAETAASVRAATMRFTETPILDRGFEPFTVAEVLEDGLPQLDGEAGMTSGLTSREARMLRLAAMPLQECLMPLRGRGAAPRLILALPEGETTRPLNGKTFLAHLVRQAGGIITLEGSDASHRGRAGGLMAIGQGVGLIAGGKASFVVAGGVDSYRDPYILATMDMEQRVKSATHLDGFVPGEAAAFVLLGDPAAALAAGLRSLARVTPAATGFESGHWYSPQPYRGDGLALTISKLVQSGTAALPFEEVYSSMNGESHWAKEWGVSGIRNKAALAEGYRIHHPADCYGDVGAASGVLMTALAALGISGGYRRSSCLIYGSSDHGQRAAIALTAV